MRRIICALALTSALMLTLVAQAAAPNFAGTWTLDKSKSQGLSQRMQGADSVQWVITQTDKEITIEEKVTGGQPPAGAPATAGAAPAGSPPAGAPAQGASGGGGGGRGGMGMGGPRTFALDGSETNVDTGRGKSVRKATWASDTLELTSKSTFQGPNGEITSTASDKLTLSGDGKTLTVVSHRESPRGAQDLTLVFTK